MTPEQENAFAKCLSAHQGPYNAITNNCTTPPQKCLTELGIYFPVLGTQSTLGLVGGSDGKQHQHTFPTDFGNALIKAHPDWKTVKYNRLTPEPSGERGKRAPWTIWYLDGQ
jgi:hypothetical protein